MRPDLRVSRQRYQGRTQYIVKDPVSLRYYRYSEQEHFLIGLLDGRTTLDQAQKEYEKHFRPDRLSLEEVEAFAHQLLTLGLAQGESAEVERQTAKRRRRLRRGETLQLLTNALYVKAPLFDPDRLLDALLPWCRWVFTGWFLLASAGLMLAALLLVGTHFDAFRDRLPSAHEFFRFRTMAWLWAAYVVVKVIHEFGHALSCKAFGGEVHELGVLFLCLSPCLYCNVSDAWILPSKWKRIVISFAGIYVELMIAAATTFVWWHSPGRPLLGSLCLSVMVVCSVSTLLFNGNPLMRYDGYYMLADWLEVPNLRSRAARFLKHLAMEHCLGMRIPPEPAMPLGRRLLFVAYVVASYLYGWVVTFGVVWFLNRLFKPYKLEAVSALLACTAAASMAGWPLWRLARGLRQRGRMPDVKPLRLLASAGVVAALSSLAVWLPLPVGQVSQQGLVRLRPGAVEEVYVSTPGTLERLHVRDGQRVEEGDVLAEFRSLEVEDELEEARGEQEVREVQLRALREEAARTDDPAARARVEAEIAAAAGEARLYAGLVEVRQKERRGLVLRAPRAGVVLGAPRQDEVGKRWEKDESRPFCGIGDPLRLEAWVPVSPAEYRLLKDELAEDPGLGVAIRAPGREGQTWKGRVARLPEAEARSVPLALTTRGGGPLPIKTVTQADVYVPQAQQYLVAVDFLESDDTVCPGTLAQVRFQCPWRTGAWWLWRTVSSTFDLQLLLRVKG